MKELLRLRANVNHGNSRGEMPITLAVQKSNVAIVELLLNTNEVKINLKTGKRQTLFDCAARVSGLPARTSSDNIANFAAGCDCVSATSHLILTKASKNPSCKVLLLLRKYAKKHNLEFVSHSDKSGRRGTLGEFRNVPIIIQVFILTIKVVDSIRKDEPKEQFREQQRADCSGPERRTSIFERETQIV